MDRTCFEKRDAALQRSPLKQLRGSDGQVFTPVVHDLENVPCDRHRTRVTGAHPCVEPLASQSVGGVLPEVPIGSTLLKSLLQNS